MSLLYSPNFRYSELELGKNNYPEFMDLSFGQIQHQGSTLTRYCSAPSSYLATLVENNHDDNNGLDGGSEDYGDLQPSSPEMDTMLERLISACNGSENSGERSSMKQEPQDYSNTNGSSQAQQVHSFHRHNPVESSAVGSNLESSFGVFCSMGLENSIQPKIDHQNNRSNLLRQSSSPAGFFSDLAAENGTSSCFCSNFLLIFLYF